MFNFEFLEKSLEIVLHHILDMIFQENCFADYFILTDQILVFDCL